MSSTTRLVPLLLAAACLGCAASQPAMLGVTDGKLAPCPSAPHCVSSQVERGTHAVPPVRFEGTREQATRKLANIIRAMPGARVVTESPDYVRAEFTSKHFHYVDDVEIYLDARAKLVHFRSSSRVGFYDFGANRRRIEDIRKKFMAAAPAAKS